MDPVEFYHQASNWFADDKDTRTVTARSIVSRAYYAAFLVAREYAGVTVKKDVHRVTIETLRRGKPKDVIIGNKLDDLRLKRTDADYEMDVLCVRRHAGDALVRSRSLLSILGAPGLSIPPTNGPPGPGSAP
jgi:ribosomal protein S3